VREAEREGKLRRQGRQNRKKEKESKEGMTYHGGIVMIIEKDDLRRKKECINTTW
jgi:hypothetical protein